MANGGFIYTFVFFLPLVEGILSGYYLSIISSGITFNSVLFSAINQMDIVSIRSVNDTLWHTFDLSLSLIVGILSGFDRSIVGGGMTHIFDFVAVIVWRYPLSIAWGNITHNCVSFYAIDQAGRFKIRSINGRRCHHLYIYFHICHCSDLFF